MANRILLIATMNWPSAARYAGGFFAAGSEVHAACPKIALVRLSRYVARTHRYRPLAPLTSLRRAIKDAEPDLLVACDDRAVSHLLRLYRAEVEKKGTRSTLAELIARSLGRQENYPRAISRSGGLQDLHERGVRVARTMPVGSARALEDCIELMGLPCVLKADGSWGGEGVAIARTKEEAHAAYAKLSRAPSRLRSLVRAWRRRDAHFLLAALKPEKRDVCIQSFISGRVSASAFAAQEGKVVAAFHYDVIVSDGEIGPPNVIRRVDDPEMDAAVEVAATCFGLSGLHGLDYIRDEKGAIHLIEINPRATQGGTLPFGAGRDLPSGLAQAFADRPVGMRPALANDIVAFFPREMRRDPASPYLSMGHHDVPHDDPDVFRAMSGMPRPRRKHAIARLKLLGLRLRKAYGHA